MTSKMFSIHAKSLVVIVGLLVTALIPANAGAAESSKTNIQDSLQTVGIIDPDGAKSVWLISSASGGDISGLLAKYPSKMIDGLKFYKVSSWRDTARFFTVVNEKQAQTIRQLAKNMQKLNKRVGNLEKKRRKIVYSGSIDSRVKALEKKVEYMSDGGLP